MSVLELKEITKNFVPIQALINVSFSIEEGQIVGFMGKLLFLKARSLTGFLI